mmetsp:Transcript_12933/g.18452  ORF Transcript_12933/g.18452 Transcript_12933/m.18452 type:complete len:176 (+) Transcript_12933:200-727(+)
MFREKINYHKTTIEQLRREMAREILNDDNPNAIHPEEMKHRSEIVQYKTTYNQSFQKLRVLKSDIEHIQHLIEKSRKKMQKDFDTWYEEMWSHTNNLEVNRNNGFDSMQTSKNSMCKSNESIAKASIQDDETKSSSSLTQSDFAVPKGVRLTGNKEADEDIIAFYRAKEELLSRS